MLSELSQKSLGGKDAPIAELEKEVASAEADREKWQKKLMLPLQRNCDQLIATVEASNFPGERAIEVFAGINLSVTVEIDYHEKFAELLIAILEMDLSISLERGTRVHDRTSTGVESGAS